MIAHLIKSNTTLTQLDLGGNRLGDESGKLLADGLKSNTTLTQLDLGGNRLGNGSGKLLAEALKRTTTLTSLDIRECSIEGDGAVQLSSAVLASTTIKQFNGVPVTFSSTLTKLDLSNNKVGEAGGLVIIPQLHLEGNASLTQLDLASNMMGDKSGGLLVAALKLNQSLTSLDISGNPMGKGNAQALRQLVSQLRGGCSECTGQAGTADCFQGNNDLWCWDECHVCGARYNEECNGCREPYEERSWHPMRAYDGAGSS